MAFYNPAMQDDESVSVSTALHRQVESAIDANGGWLPFDRFMALALYTPGLGYYARDSRQFGVLPASGSDFVTAPELSPLFGRALARQIGQALEACGCTEVWEFGAGSGALAAQLLEALGAAVSRYHVVEVSDALRQRQRERLAAHAEKVCWCDALPETMHGVIVGNEVLDAMPVQLLAFDGAEWHERGVVVEAGRLAWADRATTLRPPGAALSGGASLEPETAPPASGDEDFPSGSVTEMHVQAVAFIATLADRLERGAAFFIDYGFPEAEYYHPQRSGGTLMCHRAHRADMDPLADVGLKDITAHVDFTAIALAGQDAGLDVIGYTTQAHFLINCGLLEMLQGADVRTLAHVQKLLTEHEMGELFKVIAFAKGCDLTPLGFTTGDRSDRL